jgi:hypothetical protein
MADPTAAEPNQETPMSNNYIETAFNVPVTPDEASLLQECFAAAADLSDGFSCLPLEKMDAAKACYAARSEDFRAVFPERDGEQDPFTTFLELWSDPNFPSFDADLSIRTLPDGKGPVAFISGQQVDVFALASLIQKVCKSALPFGFEWAAVSTKLRPGELGGGYLVITDAEVLGGSTRWLMAEALQTLRAKPGAGDSEPIAAGECGEEALAGIARQIASYADGAARTNVYKAAKLALAQYGEKPRALLKELAGICDQIDNLPINDDGTRILRAGMLDRAREIATIADDI